jgi:hypothetical protein
MWILASHTSSIAEVKLNKEFSMKFTIRVSFFPCDFWLGRCWILSCQEHKRIDSMLQIVSKEKILLEWNSTANFHFISNMLVFLLKKFVI